MYHHLEKNAIEIPRDRVVEVYESCKEFLNDIELDLSENEFKAIREKIKSRNVPTPKLLFKDHKDVNLDGSYDSRFVLSLDNFASGLPKVGYKAIKKVFDRNNINYERYGIKNSLDVKEKLEKLDINLKKHTVSKLDIIDMYPSVKIGMIRKAVEFYSQGLPLEEKKIVRKAMELVEWGMRSSLLTFDRKYFEYGRVEDLDDKGISIGAYEWAFFADLVANFAYSKTSNVFEAETWFMETYRDDGLQLWKKIMSMESLSQ